MPSQTSESVYSAKKLVLMALFVAVALVLSYIERLIPLNFAIPGVKLGLTNVVTCIALYTFTPRESFLIVLVRIFLVGIFIGSATSFLYSFAGGVLSFIGMLIVLKLFNKYVSAIGVSVVGAFLHNLGQVIVLAIITNSLSVALTYFPILILTGVITGVVVGFTALLILRYMKHFRLVQIR